MEETEDDAATQLIQWWEDVTIEGIVVVLDAATDPNLAGSQAERIRQRLAQAGLLEPFLHDATARPSPEAVRQAGLRAASGRSLAELVHEGR